MVAETVGLTKVHGSGAHATEVFRDLSLGFESGRLSAVTGPSGSGKSTLLNLLAGLDLPTAGDVVVAGRPLSQLDATGRAELRRDRIGLVTQGTDLVPFLTAQESVELALALRGVDRGEATERATDSLAAVGLAELATQRVARLSMGERQRVALARALSARPELLLADEPTARLDEANARAVGVLFAELAQRTGTAIVCATHDPVLIEHAATEVARRNRYRGGVSQASVDLLLRGYRAFVAGDLDAIESMLDPEVEWVGVGAAPGPPTARTCSRSSAAACRSSTR